MSESENPKVKVNPPAAGPSGPGRAVGLRPLVERGLSPAAKWMAELDGKSGGRRRPRPWVLDEMACSLAERGLIPRAELLPAPAGERPAEGWEVKAHGGMSGAKRAIRRGRLPPGRFGGWTVGFLAGLRDAGAIRRVGSTALWVPDSAPVWLREELLSRPPFHYEVVREDGGFFVKDAWFLLSNWPLLPHGGVERLAGVLAGSPRVGKWVMVGNVGKRILNIELVRFATRGRKMVKVSRFWMALVGCVAPHSARPWMESTVGAAGGCPLLPAVVWAACFSGFCGFPIVTVTGVLPWMKSEHDMGVLRLGRKLRRAKAVEWWPAGPRAWVRECGLEWVRRSGRVAELERLGRMGRLGRLRNGVIGDSVDLGVVK